ncbi:putative D-serine dehydratase [Sporosarcina sp. NCCP-2222]|uniref:D-serine ammonia-lyase n=1 Tax=Sporosarcina sp. NCCP-2222 TaxID=2935073 RepID=UPI0020806FF6|nr:D-serine ammonia-lyase [Sporosarcina sp. NCCP-2222]GKV55226.1 putative D-serine dehydratase [Sporosarcina sp. NCCP-2222]
MNEVQRAQLVKNYPLIQELIGEKEVLWLNSESGPAQEGIKQSGISDAAVQEASGRLMRFAPYIAKVFPETAPAQGIIESPLTKIPAMAKSLGEAYEANIPGKLYLKEDNALPISGSIKARGGIYEVLKHAETIALDKGLITEGDNYSKFDEPELRNELAKHKIAVGSTGNLGLSIGIMSAKLGFNVTVHMSADAKQWKKDMLREKGVTVVEYADDYSKAVEEGRKQAEADPLCHFVDDENSIDLFLGYAVAGERVAAQLKEHDIQVDKDHPLFVYLPCGVGGGPGGVAFGLKRAFGDHVHCFFAEPTHSPCMLLGMMTGLHEEIAVNDIGLDNKTVADGLAVGRPSGFVGKTMAPLIEGCYTIADQTMFRLLAMLADAEGIRLEPSGLAGMTGPIQTINNKVQDADHPNATHLVWATGGGMVPESEMAHYYGIGKEL